MTGANSNLFGFYCSTGVSSTFTGQVDNLSVSAVPEPSTVACSLALLGLGGIVVRRRCAH